MEENNIDVVFYDAANTALVGHPTIISNYLNSLNVEDYNRQLFSDEDNTNVTRELSPYNNVEVMTKNKNYPSLIKYLLSLRICYNKEIAKLIETDDIDEIRHIVNKNKKACHKVYLKFAEQYKIRKSDLYIKDGFDDVDAYLINKIKNGLEVLYNIFSKSSRMKSLLISTNKKNIVFHDEDTLLGDGLDGKGLNLLGKKLMEIRAMLQRVHVVRAICEEVVPNFIYMNDPKTFSDFENLLNTKLQYISKLTGSFFEYLCYSRPGYLQIKSVPQIISPFETDKILVLSNDKTIDSFFVNLQKQEVQKMKVYKEELQKKKLSSEKLKELEKKKEELIYVTRKIDSYKTEKGDTMNGWKTTSKNLGEVKNYINSLQSVSPIISGEIVLSVINDIMNCNISDNFNKISFPTITDTMRTAIEKYIKAGIKDEYLSISAEISDRACFFLYSYILHIAEYIIINSTHANQPDFVAFSKHEEEMVSTDKRDIEDYNFDSTEENAALQCMLYLVIAITDWLDMDYATKTEFKFVETVLSLDQKENLFKQLLKNPNKEKYKKDVIQVFVQKGIIIYENDLEYILNLMYTIVEKMNNNDVLKNRVYFYANFI
jgi:hypothetical protein